MNIAYLKSQFIPKNNTWKIIYGILWILEPAFMAILMSYKIMRNKKK